MRGVDIIRTMLAWFANVTPENLEQEISTAFCLFDVGPALLLSLPTSPPTPRHPSYPSVPPSLPLSYLSICLVQNKAPRASLNAN